MPMFEYRCEKCGEKFEKLVRGGEKITCPACGGRKTKKLFSTFGVKSGDRFTGSGGSSCDTCSATSCNTCKSA